MAQPPKPVIVRIQQQTSFSAAGQPIVQYAVTFTVGEHGPFTLSIDAADFTKDEVLKRVAALAETVNQVAAPAGA